MLTLGDVSEFVRLLESLGTERWWWLRVFTVDVLIYQGRLAEAARELRHTLTHRLHQLPTTFISTNLKLASVLYALNNLSVCITKRMYLLPGFSHYFETDFLCVLF